MSMPAQHVKIPPFETALPVPIYFRSACMPAHATYPRHRHAWGEFVYSYSGVMEIETAGHHYLAPPQYGIWLPPDLEHVGFNRHEACHCSLYLAAELCAALPTEACALTLSPLIRALLEELRSDPPGQSQTPEQQRLLQVLVDKLTQAPHVGSYLPSSDDPLLGSVLRTLEANPGDPRSLPELARAAHTTERTLMRRAQRDLGMSLMEWRQRLKVIEALARLERGQTVETIGLDLGYNSASAFISMFRKMMGTTPDEYRRRHMA
ncbi:MULTISPECIES: AraC family transcriptional regulator [Pseudomonas]|uniref:AraC family transcriptional regulator n=1 Tax=Pseudomonas TaxID=286 RepID=UPI001BE55C87|nr:MULTISPECIES: helix-turn-helix transcriptional regulator [Pseudomonas]MBT2341565.1 helix-turn-helix transcriptional regulator [Pseudomonas fluorescens]MCD4531034.1 helix-turn-helix transcriptional regulator [Pseudomonas sp. C3-2018]